MNAQKIEVRQLNASMEVMGLSEGIHLNSATVTTGKFFAFQVIADAVVATLSEHGEDVPEMVGATLTSGFVYYGYITSIKLTSGHVKLFQTTLL